MHNWYEVTFIKKNEYAFKFDTKFKETRLLFRPQATSFIFDFRWDLKSINSTWGIINGTYDQLFVFFPSISSISISLIKILNRWGTILMISNIVHMESHLSVLSQIQSLPLSESFVLSRFLRWRVYLSETTCIPCLRVFPEVNFNVLQLLISASFASMVDCTWGLF